MPPRLQLNRLPSLTAGKVTPRRLAAPSQLTSTSFRRFASTQYYSQAPEKKGIKIGHLFTGLAVLGLSATAYGLYQFYSTFNTYPNTSSHPIRSHLRAALRSSSAGDYGRASRSFEQAYALARDLANSGGMGSREDALMKTSGVAIRWGQMYEESGEFGKAIEKYDLAWKEVTELMSGDGAASEKEVMRGVAVAMKMGDVWIGNIGGKDGEIEAEKCYTFCVEELMRLSMTDGQKSKVKEEMEAGGKFEKAPEDTEEQENLPVWAGKKVEIVAAFERLGDLYARAGKVEYAQPLLQQAIVTLFPPPPKSGPRPLLPSIPTRCHAATLMNNLSSSFVTAPSPTKSNIDQAARWARQALTVSNACRKEADSARGSKEVPLGEKEEQECEMVAIVGAYNLGKLSELSGDKDSAKNWFEKSLVHSKRLGVNEGVRQSSEALRRLKV